MPIILAIIALLVSFLFSSSNVFAQAAATPESRAAEFAQALDKTKHKIKEKKGFRVEVYAEVRHEPAVKNNPREYSGDYESEDAGFSLNIQVAADGSVTGGGFETENGRQANGKFTLENARIEGAVLSGVKVYENGERRKFEGIFANRTISVGTSPDNISNRSTDYGFAAADEYAVIEDGKFTSRLFYRQKR